MTELEEEIVAALRTQAERRPNGMAVRAALNGRRPRKRVLVIAAAAVVVAAIAITVPVVLHRASGDPAQPAGLRVPPPAPPVTAMDVVPGWLPPRVVELERTSDATAFTRVWLDGAVDGDGTPVVSPEVSLSVGPGHLPANGKALTVNGKPAKELTGENDTRVIWEAAPGRLITVSAAIWPDAQQAAIAERVANSVRPGDTVRFTPQLRFDRLPAGWTDEGARVFRSGRAEPAMTHLAAKTTVAGHEFVLTLGPQRNGEPGLLHAERDGYEVVFEGKDTTSGHLPGWPDFSGVLAAIQVDEHADVSWIGQR